jgi:ABC-type transport system substrate-binding protein
MGEPASMDPNANSQSPAAQYYSLVYSNLLKFGKTTDGTRPPVSAITGDAAESFETSPDGLTLTLKLRQNHKFDPRPPTNGRAMDTTDVK